jgi:hypothetical protein
MVACDPVPVRGLLLRLPELPDAWAAAGGAGAMSFRLTLCDSGGQREIARGLPLGGAALIPWKGDPGAQFLAWPEGPWSGLRPAGCVPVLEPSGAEIAVSFESGWLALVRAHVVAADPLSAQCFNWPRLTRELSERGGDSWIVDPQEAALAILSGEFSLDFLAPMRGEETAIPLARTAGPDEGPWICPSPFARSSILREGERPILLLSWKPQERTLLYALDSRILIEEVPGRGLRAAFLEASGEGEDFLALIARRSCAAERSRSDIIPIFSEAREDGPRSSFLPREPRSE